MLGGSQGPVFPGQVFCSGRRKRLDQVLALRYLLETGAPVYRCQESAEWNRKSPREPARNV